MGCYVQRSCDLDAYSLEIYQTCENELPASSLSKVIVACEWMHLVTCGHVIDGRYTVWSVIVKNTMLHANFMAVPRTEPELWEIKVSHCGNRDCPLFLLLWPSFTNLTRNPHRYTGCASINILPQDFAKLSSDIHTYRHGWNYIPHHFVGGKT